MPRVQEMDSGPHPASFPLRPSNAATLGVEPAPTADGQYPAIYSVRSDPLFSRREGAFRDEAASYRNAQAHPDIGWARPAMESDSARSHLLSNWSAGALEEDLRSILRSELLDGTSALRRRCASSAVFLQSLMDSLAFRDSAFDIDVVAREGRRPAGSR